MAWTLKTVQDQIASEIDQDDSAPTEGGTDWNIRLNAINRALFDWENSNEWEALKVVHNGKVTVAGFATYSLPADFKKLDSFPRLIWDGASFAEFPVVDASKNKQYTDSDKFVNIFNNSKDGKAMYIHASTLASGASIQFTYYKSPQSLASATNIVEVPDPTYLVQRGLYYIYKGSEDGRFPEAKVEADRILARMIEFENSRGIADNERRISNWNEERFNFRIGRD